MQILKGNNYKSETVENILNNTNSYCYVYYESQLPFENYYVNSKVATLNQLQGYLQEFVDYKNPDLRLDYFIIYTNTEEQKLSDLMHWLNDKESDFNCKCILITCK